MNEPEQNQPINPDEGQEVAGAAPVSSSSSSDQSPVYIYIGYSIAGGNIAELSYQLESDEGNKRVCGI